MGTLSISSPKIFVVYNYSWQMSNNRVYLSVLEEFYRKAHRNDTALNFPHSDVYYVRAKIRQDTGIEYGLEHVERAMKAEGWKEP